MAASRLLSVPGGQLEYLRTGAGGPVTLFAPGLGGGIPDIRPLGSGVPGTKVFLRGPGAERTPTRWRYADLAADLQAAADTFQARQALGVSLGAGALCRLVADHPERFDRLVCFLPAVLDVPRDAVARSRIRELAAAIAGGSRDAVAELVAAEIPPRFRNTAAARGFIAERVANLTTTGPRGGADQPGPRGVADRPGPRGGAEHPTPGPDGGAVGLAEAMAGLADEVAVPEVTALRRVTAPVLVIGCRGDGLHPVEVAVRLAAALPRSTLHLYDEPGPLWTHRADLRKRISGWLAG
ncbi:MAG: alpha/beta fold hydrolase [Micromonosporaceae bacterium]